MYTGRGGGEGLTANVMSNPQHPYTIGLCSAACRRWSSRGSLLLTIPGQVPNLSRLPPAALLAERCVHAMQVCGERPVLTPSTVTNKRKRACWLPQQELS
jgi:peptide/nickel transport system ATP-binding protein